MEEIDECFGYNNPGERLLELYQSRGYNKINQLLRTKESELIKSELIIKDKIEKNLNLFLKTSPKIIKFCNKTLYRDDPNFIEEWFIENKNKVVAFPSYLSTYRSIEQCKNRDVVKIITLSKNTRAFDILKFEPNNPEKEVLFLANTNFEIRILKNQIILYETKKKPLIILYENTEFYSPKGNGKKSFSDLNLI